MPSYYKLKDFPSWVVIRKKKVSHLRGGKMRGKFGVLICVLLLGNCLGSFVVEKNSLKLTSPESIKGVYECAIGNLGVPRYGGTLVGTVIYPKANQRACRGFDAFDNSFRSRRGGLPIILLVDRGDCFFTLKQWYAQEAGAAAILIVDNIDEPLITFDTPEEEHHYDADYTQEITIPLALISKSLGDSIKKALTSGEMVTVNLEWRESPRLHDHEQVEYEFWTNSNDGCGPTCNSQIEFVKNFKGAARILERKGYTKFTPHYKTWYCPEAFILSRRCKSQCINHGRYCAPDPEQNFGKGYDGKDVVVQNLRQACLFRVANESGKPWIWWDYVTDFAIRCRMEGQGYTKECADRVIRSLGVDLTAIDKCIGDTEADVDNPVLRAEQDAQIGKGSRGDVTTLPTLVINNKQYRGKLDKGAVLKAICEGFQETTDQAICLSEGLESYDVGLKEKRVRVKGSVQHEADKQKVTVKGNVKHEAEMQKETVNVQPDAVLQIVSKTEEKTTPSGKQNLQLNLWQNLQKLLPQLNPFPVNLLD